MKLRIFLLLVLSIAWLAMESLSISSAASDGELTVSSSDTIVNDYAYLTGNEAAGDNVLAVNDASAFSAGDEILISQMQITDGGAVGEYELAEITSINGNEVTLSSNLQHSYYSGSFDSENATVAQVVRVPEYTTVTIDSGASITAKAWDGYSGGIIAFKAESTVTNNGSINANAKGYRGGDKLPNQDMASPGESYTGISIAVDQTTANDGGGGFGSQTTYAGGGNGAHGGGGGGHQTTGQDGELSDGSPVTAPEGGISYSDASSEMLTFGSGGGAGGIDSYQQAYPTGGNGGGIVYILSPTIVNNGTITANGANGETPSGGKRGGAGGGAGGYVYFVTNSTELGAVEVNGGSGGQSSIPSRGVGGAGGTGYYLADAPPFTTEIKLTASDPGTGDYFAKSVDIDGSFAIVGALYHDEVGSNSGGAYIFERDESGWDEQSELIASDAESKDLFGASVAINGDYALVGAPDADHRNGAAYIFKRDGESWTQQVKLIPNPENKFARRRFGSAVDISGDYAIVGVPYAGLPNYGGSNAGAAYIFKREGEEWLEQKILYASDGAAQDGFAASVAIDGDYAIVGAPYNDDNGNNSGSAYIFARNGSDWVPQGDPLTASNAAAEDRFGVVAISGDVAIIGAPVGNREQNRAGNAYVFVRNGESWSEQAQLSISDALAGNNFGGSVAIDGDTIVVGARFEHYHTGDWLDGAYLFTRQGNTWPQQDKLVSSDLGVYDRFGESVAISGGRIIVGAPADDDNGHYTSGSVYIFE
ncbi:MAG: FG-GAP repeat protein [Ardenticatenaceae bacterium]